MQRGVAKGLKVPCLFMIAEVSIRCQKTPGGWYTPYTPQYTTGTGTCFPQKCPFQWGDPGPSNTTVLWVHMSLPLPPEPTSDRFIRFGTADPCGH